MFKTVLKEVMDSAEILYLSIINKDQQISEKPKIKKSLKQTPENFVHIVKNHTI